MLARTIKGITHEKYSHISIAFDENCKEMYSFGRKFRYFPFWGIFKREYLDEGLFLNKNANMAICEINVTKEQYENAKKRIQEIKDTNRSITIGILKMVQQPVNPEKLRIIGFHWRILPNI